MINGIQPNFTGVLHVHGDISRWNFANKNRNKDYTINPEKIIRTTQFRKNVVRVYTDDNIVYHVRKIDKKTFDEAWNKALTTDNMIDLQA